MINRALQYLPMSRWGDEIQAALHSVVGHLTSVDPRLCIEIILKLTVDVINNWLPAEDHTFTSESGTVTVTMCRNVH